MYRKLFSGLAILALTLSTLACGANFNLKEIKTGPTQTDELSIPLPDASGNVNLSLLFGAGELRLNPGAEGALLTGAATYNVADFAPTVEQTGNVVTVQQGDLNVTGIPNFEGNLENTWDFQLANTPLDLTIKAGGYMGRLALGGLSIASLRISDGAADVTLTFSETNPIEMDDLVYETGASNVTITGLANANVSDVSFASGAGSYKLDFSGELQRDMNVTIDSGISNVTLIVPAGVNVVLTFDGGLSNVSIEGDWTKDGNNYSQTGSGYTITIKLTMGAGNLSLQNK